MSDVQGHFHGIRLTPYHKAGWGRHYLGWRRKAHVLVHGSNLNGRGCVHGQHPGGCGTWRTYTVWIGHHLGKIMMVMMGMDHGRHHPEDDGRWPREQRIATNPGDEKWIWLDPQSHPFQLMSVSAESTEESNVDGASADDILI